MQGTKAVPGEHISLIPKVNDLGACRKAGSHPGHLMPTLTPCHTANRAGCLLYALTQPRALI